MNQHWGKRHAEARADLERLGTETAFEVLARADALQRQGKSIINLGIGQPDFKTPAHIVEAAIKALRDGHHGYTPAQGILPLREAVAADLEAPPRRRRASRHHRHLAGRQADHVLLDPDVRPARRRDHVSGPRLPDLSLDDRVHRRQAGADRAERGQPVQLHRRPGAVADHAQDQPDHPQQPGQSLRRRRPARRRSKSWSPAWNGTPTSPSCRTRSTARCSTAAASTRASCAIPRSRIA